MRIDQADAATSEDVLADEVLDQLSLAAAGGADDMTMLKHGPIRNRNGTASFILPEA